MAIRTTGRKIAPARFVVRLYVGATNRDIYQLLDMARRQADLVGGRDGFSAKAGQRNSVFARKGYLRLQFSTRTKAKAYQKRVADLQEQALTTKRFRGKASRSPMAGGRTKP